MPFSILIDKDALFGYRNGSKEDSRDANGFFLYAKGFTRDAKAIFSSKKIPEKLVASLESSLLTNHTGALIALEPYGIVVFKFNLEMDLMNSKGGRLAMMNALNKPIATPPLTILTQYKEAIKAPDKISTAIETTNANALPKSYIYVKRLLQSLSNK